MHTTIEVTIQFDSNFVEQRSRQRSSFRSLDRVETYALAQVGPNLLRSSLGPWDLPTLATSEQIKKVILRIRVDNTGVKEKKRKMEKEDGPSQLRWRYALAHLLQVQPSLRVWVSVNSGYEPTECSSGSSSCRWGSRNWRSSLVKILTLGGKLGAVASRKELQLNSRENGRISKERWEAGRRAWIINQDS